MLNTEIINDLCEKFGVTVKDLIQELYEYNIAMDWIQIAVCMIVIVITTIIFIKFYSKWKKAFEEGTLLSIIVAIPISVILIIAIYIPYIIYDMVSWYISPIASTLNFIMK